jgi:hypothetical protein
VEQHVLDAPAQHDHAHAAGRGRDQRAPEAARGREYALAMTISSFACSIAAR